MSFCRQVPNYIEMRMIEMTRFEMYPTIVTPMLEDGRIDWKSLGKLIAHYAKIDCDGIFAVCQSSEMFFLTEEEKLELAEYSIRLCHEHGMKCVVSGHTQDDLNDQIAYLQALEKLHPDAVILVNNRLAAEDEPESVAFENLRTVCKALSPETRLGVYECPYPYKRLLTDSFLKALVEDGRFDFVKDTCCHIDKIRKRLECLKGTTVQLYNANSATLLESIRAGAAGYSGVMLNILPAYFEQLKRAFHSENEHRVRLLCSALSAASMIEWQNYPANAKYLLMRSGLATTSVTRNGKPPLTESQMGELNDFAAITSSDLYQMLPHKSVHLLFEQDTFFPECHASTVFRTKSGRTLVAYFAGTAERDDDVGIWLSVCDHNVWQSPRCIAKLSDEAHWNPVLYACGDGVGILFKVGRTIPGWRSYFMYSADEGETWTAPEAMPKDNPAGGPVRNKPICLSDGRMLAPASDETLESWLPRIDISGDDGRTFHKLADIPVQRDDPSDANYMTGLGAIQPTLWESAPGKVHALLRTTAGCIFRSDSEDGGRTWCMAYPTPLPNNNSGIDLVDADGTLYLVMNPVSGNWAARTPIVVMRSTDGGEHFETEWVLESTLFDEVHNKMCEFSYPAIIYTGKELLITFTYCRKSIAFCRIPLDEA